ncbi:hypothetical protein B0H14DRAFT_2905398 [Mycena olivaceomarginata]|nr:hypothetical protein B0H14DRAFT_2905398 [Mycena olivaceomarginata]
MKHARLFPQANQRPQRSSTPLRPRVCVPPCQTGAFSSPPSLALALQLRLAHQLSRHTRRVPTLDTTASNKSVSASRFPYSMTISVPWPVKGFSRCTYQAGTRAALPKTVVGLNSAYAFLSVSFERHSRAPVLLAPPPNTSGKNSEPSPLR